MINKWLRSSKHRKTQENFVILRPSVLQLEYQIFFTVFNITYMEIFFKIHLNKYVIPLSAFLFIPLHFIKGTYLASKYILMNYIMLENTAAVKAHGSVP